MAEQEPKAELKLIDHDSREYEIVYHPDGYDNDVPEHRIMRNLEASMENAWGYGNG